MHFIQLWKQKHQPLPCHDRLCMLLRCGCVVHNGLEGVLPYGCDSACDPVTVLNPNSYLRCISFNRWLIPLSDMKPITPNPSKPRSRCNRHGNMIVVIECCNIKEIFMINSNVWHPTIIIHVLGAFHNLLLIALLDETKTTQPSKQPRRCYDVDG